MEFVAGKLVAQAAQPSSLLLLGLVLGVLGLGSRAKVWAGRLLAACVGVLATVTVLPVGLWLTLPLENRFPLPQRYPDQIDGVIVLGNGPNGTISAARDEAALSEPAERFAAMIELARVFPGARLVFSGGSGSVLGEAMSEAAAVRLYYERQGLDPARIRFEDRSRNTYENARNTTALVAPEPGERWLLVTTARDMPRAIGVFRGQGFPVDPWPVDFLTTGEVGLDLSLRMPQRLWQLDNAVHEWLGLVVYRWRGWTDELLPGPR